MGILKTNEEKLDFILDYLEIKVKDIADAFGVKPPYVSRIRVSSYNNLKPMHLYALERIYDIPYLIFEDSNIDTKDKIKYILDNRNIDMTQCKNNIFFNNDKVMANLEGIWYAYFYSSAYDNSLYCIETIISPNGKVVDENSNFGQVFVGENQSMIIKQAHNSKNLISITFDNSTIAYGKFPFILTSKTNQLNEMMTNFGFFSHKKVDLEVAKDILLDISDLQLKMKYTLIERICQLKI